MVDNIEVDRQNMDLIAMEIKRESLLSWDRLSVGYCHKCSKAHSLVDKLCWNCREEGK